MNMQQNDLVDEIQKLKSELFMANALLGDYNSRINVAIKDMKNVLDVWAKPQNGEQLRDAINELELTIMYCEGCNV